MAGFVSATGDQPTRRSIIDYFTPINQPFTEYSVIRELLKQSEEATMEVGQEYILNTFDIGGAMKALPLIWKFPEEYLVWPGAMVSYYVNPGSNFEKMLEICDLIDAPDSESKNLSPHSLGTADGFFNKNHKAAMLHYMTEDAPEDVPYPKEAFYIQDGNALFHALDEPPTNVRRNLSPVP
ncbi:unnamed protein product [Boreogadus saida]